MRAKIYNIINTPLYNIIMILIILLSLIPLTIKNPNIILIQIENISTIIFIFDYILRLSTADFYYNKKGIKSFLKYPIGFYSLIDLISILSALPFMNNAYKILKIFRIVKTSKVSKTFKILKSLKLFRYSKNIVIIANVIKKEKESLITVLIFAIFYIFISALIIFNVEPNSFSNYFEAIYWATISLTTMGYGDIYPITTPGRVITMLSSIFGIAIIALPSGIITAGYLNEINKKDIE